MVITLIDYYEKILFAICMWREARNQPRLVRIGVKHAILNRVRKPAGPYAKCKTVIQNILRGAYPSKLAAQFSCFNRNDKNSSLLPDPGYKLDWIAFLECCAIVDEVTVDPTGGADHYYDVSIDPPYWATPENYVRKIGKLVFHKLY